MSDSTKRDRALRAGLIATVVGGVGLGAWAQTDFDAVEIVVHPVAGNVESRMPATSQASAYT